MGLTANVAPEGLIQSSWGNEIRDRTVQVFATSAELQAQWPAAPTGARAVTLDGPYQWTKTAAGWVALPAGAIRTGTVTFPATGSLGSIAPPSLAGFWNTAADGTMTFLLPCLAAVDIGASRGGATDLYVRCYGPRSQELWDSVSRSIGGTTSRVWLSRVVPVPGGAGGSTLRLVGMSSAGVMNDVDLVCRVMVLAGAVYNPAGPLLGANLAVPESEPFPEPTDAELAADVVDDAEAAGDE